LPALWLFLPFGQARKQPFFRFLGPRDMRAKHLRPWPAQFDHALQDRPRARALRPIGALACFDQNTGRALQERGHFAIIERRINIGYGACLARRRGDPLTGMAGVKGGEGEAHKSIDAPSGRVSKC